MKYKIDWLKSEWQQRPRHLRKTSYDIFLFKLQAERTNPEMLNFKELIHDRLDYLKNLLELEK